MTQYGMPI